MRPSGLRVCSPKEARGRILSGRTSPGRRPTSDRDSKHCRAPSSDLKPAVSSRRRSVRCRGRSSRGGVRPDGGVSATDVPGSDVTRGYGFGRPRRVSARRDSCALQTVSPFKELVAAIEEVRDSGGAATERSARLFRCRGRRDAGANGFLSRRPGMKRGQRRLARARFGSLGGGKARLRNPAEAGVALRTVPATLFGAGERAPARSGDDSTAHAFWRARSRAWRWLGTRDRCDRRFALPDGRTMDDRCRQDVRQCAPRSLNSRSMRMNRAGSRTLHRDARWIEANGGGSDFRGARATNAAGVGTQGGRACRGRASRVISSCDGR